MVVTGIPRKELGRTEAFLSYDNLSEINCIDPNRQFRYATRGFYTPSAEFHNRALMLGIGENSYRTICEELKNKGYIGLVEIEVINSRTGVNQVEIEVINSRTGVNQIRGRPVVSA